MTGRLEGQAATVTGAGSGIGRATTKRLMADGADVLAVDLNGVGLAETADFVSGEPGRSVTLARNITEDDTPTAIISAGVEAFGGVRILVDSAGTGGAVATHMTVDDDLDRFVDVNLHALFRMARGSVTAICTGGKGGSIVQLASTFGIMGVPNSSVYSATKAVVIGLTCNMAADYGPYNIRVNAIAPGMIFTPMNRDRFKTNEYFRDMPLSASPQGRVGAPRGIANGIAFLYPDEVSFITGHTLAIDGAWSTNKFRPFDPSLHE